MTHREIMLAEKARVQKLLAAALDEIENEGGNIRFFAAALNRLCDLRFHAMQNFSQCEEFA